MADHVNDMEQKGKGNQEQQSETGHREGHTGVTQKYEDLEQQKLELERYKTKMDFLKFMWGSVVAAIAIAAIPPLFQLATAVLQNAKSDAELRSKQQAFSAELLSKQQAFRDEYVKSFVTSALDQDIELRIRLAQYFARVTTDAFRDGWIGYRDDLVKRKKDVQDKIEEIELELQRKTEDSSLDLQTLERLERNLRWLYKELGYAERGRPVVTGAPKAE